MLNNHEASLLFSLRSETTREFGANFPYNINQKCALGCQELDTPRHCMICPYLKSEKAHAEAHIEDIVNEDLFSDILSKQIAVTKLFAALI